MIHSNIRTVKIMSVIVVESVVGEGILDDPCRQITEYFSTDGKLLALVDSWEQERLEKCSSSE